MLTRMILLFFVVFALAGCATYSKKQTGYPLSGISEKSQKAYKQESYSRGYEDDNTWLSDSFEKTDKKNYSEPSTELSLKQVQRALKSAGFYDGPIDGKIGPKTRAAIIKFQKTNGLKADGIVGKRTSAELNRYLSR